MIKLYVPQDMVACALGADQLAAQLQAIADQQGLQIELIRNGSRGLFWLETLVEVERGDERVALGPVSEDDAESIIQALSSDISQHPLFLGDIEQHEYFTCQQRLTFARAGRCDPLCLDHYRDQKGFEGLRKALTMQSQEIVDQVKQSGLRGRGGAAFPTGIKWQTVLDAQGEQKYIACNADEGDSGTFADRLLMEADPYQLIEGMTIAGLAVGATEGFIYLRSEYPKAHQILDHAIA
ncbi:MAG: hypothetical protein KJP04_10755, partial [Arenicella sp.]|nr:hypothetical protein [Arenicella sp.]